MAARHGDAARTASVALQPVGRDRELHLLGELLDSAIDGNGRLLLIEGVSGVGKTTLIQHAKDMATDRGMQVHSITGSELETDYPFSALLKSFTPWHAKLDDEQRLALAHGRAGAAMSLLESNQHGDSDDFSIILGLYWLTVRLSEQAPLLLAVDDAQWIDEPSLRFINYLASALEDLPILMVVAVRLGDPRADDPLIGRLTSFPTSLTAAPSALTEEQVGLLLQRDLPALADIAGAAERFHATTGGNPFLLRQVIHAVSSDPETDPQASLHNIDSFAPPSIQRHIVRRIARLGAPALNLSRAFAVLGKSASLDLAARVSGMDLATAADVADRLIRADVLNGTSHPAFSHPTVRAAVLGDMTPSSIAATHGRVARCMHLLGEPAEQMAHHLVEGITVDEPWAASALQSAALQAARNGLPSTAVRYLEHAVGLAPHGQDRVLLEVDLALAEVACGFIAEAVGRLESAVEQLQAPLAQARCMLALGMTLVRHAQYAEATRVLERCQSLARHEDPELAREAEGLALVVAYFLDNSTISIDRADHDAMTATARSVEPRTPAERGLLAISALHSVVGGPDVARGAELAAEALSGQPADSSTAIQMDYVAILALIYADQFDLAAQAIAVHHAYAMSTGAVPAMAEACLLQCTLDLMRGHLSDAEVNATIAVNATEQGWSALLPMAQGQMLLCLVHRGDLDRADRFAAEIQPAATKASGTLPAWTHAALGHLHLARGRYREALQSFLTAGDLVVAHRATSPAVLRWRSSAGRAALGCGDTELAERLIDEELQLARDFDLPRAEGAALCARAFLLPPGERHAHLTRARELLEKSGNPVDLAECLTELGAEQRILRRLPEARETLRTALDLAHRHGAVAVEQNVREELRAAGARVRQVAQHGFASLTPTERRVAELAGAGLTNSEIGEEIFLARSTVAWYMRRVLRKLDLTSRSDIALHLAGSPLDDSTA